MLRLLLFPLSILYDLITRVRNHLFDIGHKPSFRFELPVISVGNLNAGGSGKTPMTEYLIRLLSRGYRVATLSRGYGRRTRGFRIANASDNAATIGDEPFQMYRKFGDIATITVSEDRAFAIPTILQEDTPPEIILLDDAFQHRSVVPALSILLTEYGRPFTRDFVLPAGNLREARKGAARADVVVVTKCPERVDEVTLTAEIRKYAPGKPVFFSRLVYGEPVSFGSFPNPTGRIIVVTGIANPTPLLDYLGRRYEVIRHMSYADHHSFTDAELNDIHYEAAQFSDVSLFTTEKDMVRIKDRTSVASHPWFYLPVTMEFVKNGSEFDELIARQLKHD